MLICRSVARAAEKKKERKGRENWNRGRRLAMTKSKFGERVRQQFPTDEAPASITEHYGFLYARVSISFTTASTPDAPSRILAGRDKCSNSNSSSFARVLEVEHSHLVEASSSSSSASSIVAHRHSPRSKHVRAQQTEIQADGAAHCSAAHPLHPTSHLCRCMGL
jgi:hypothetical protein